MRISPTAMRGPNMHVTTQTIVKLEGMILINRNVGEISRILTQQNILFPCEWLVCQKIWWLDLAWCTTFPWTNCHQLGYLTIFIHFQTKPCCIQRSKSSKDFVFAMAALWLRYLWWTLGWQLFLQGAWQVSGFNCNSWLNNMFLMPDSYMSFFKRRVLGTHRLITIGAI